MTRLLIFIAALSLGISAVRGGSPPEIYSTPFWEIAGPPGKVTWVEIHNIPEAQTTGVAHVSIITRKKGAPVWELEWVCPHVAITTDALRRSVIRPFKTRGSYPERFNEAYYRWQQDEQKGTAQIYSTSIQDFLKQHPPPTPASR